MQRMTSHTRPAGEYSTRLRALRLQHGLSQEDVARIMRCSIPSVSRYERHLGEMTVSQVLRLLAFFRCRFEDLIDMEEN